jgi:hypothetical protein
MTGLTKRRRKPYPSVRRPRKTAFTPAMWARWMIEKGWLATPSDEGALQLRAGIAEFRQRLGVVSDTEARS